MVLGFGFIAMRWTYADQPQLQVLSLNIMPQLLLDQSVGICKLLGVLALVRGALLLGHDEVNQGEVVKVVRTLPAAGNRRETRFYAQQRMRLRCDGGKVSLFGGESWQIN